MPLFIASVPSGYTVDQFVTDTRLDQTKGVFSQAVSNNLLSLISIMQYKSSYGTELPADVIEEVTSLLVAKEDEIESSNILESDKMLSLQGASILRHSLNYWGEQQSSNVPLSTDSFWESLSNAAFADCRGMYACLGIAGSVAEIPGASVVVEVVAAAVWSCN